MSQFFQEYGPLFVILAVLVFAVLLGARAMRRQFNAGRRSLDDRERGAERGNNNSSQDHPPPCP